MVFGTTDGFKAKARPQNQHEFSILCRESWFMMRGGVIGFVPGISTTTPHLSAPGDAVGCRESHPQRLIVNQTVE